MASIEFDVDDIIILHDAQLLPDKLHDSLYLLNEQMTTTCLCSGSNRPSTYSRMPYAV